MSRQGLVDAGVALGLPPAISQREIEAMASRIGPALDAIIRQRGA